MAIIYTTDQTVTIEYDPTRALFRSQGEHLPFSAERLLRMLHERALECRLQVTVFGRLQVVVGEARCELTQQAVAVLLRLYCREFQREYPLLREVFASVAGVPDAAPLPLD